MARKSLCKKSFIVENGRPSGVLFSFAHGKEVTVYADDHNDYITDMLLCMGIAQKYGDRYAGLDTPEEALAGLLDLREQLKAGNWTAKADTSSDLVEALIRIAADRGKDAPREDVITAVREMSDKDRKDLAAKPSVKATIAKIKLERLEAAAADADDDLPLDF